MLLKHKNRSAKRKRLLSEAEEIASYKTYYTCVSCINVF